MVASSGLIARERNDSDAKHLSDRLILVWCSCEIPGDINMPAACYRYSSDDRVHDSTVLSENSKQMSIGLRAIIIPPGVREILYPLWPLNEEGGSVQEGPKRESFFFAKVIPARKTALSSLRVSSSKRPSKIQARHRSSIEQQTTATPAATADEEADLFVGNESRVFPESFPSFVPGTSTKAESTYVLSNNRIDPCRVSARELLKLLALFRPSRVIIQPQADRTAKSHESRRNTTVKLKRSKTPWLSWWHCNKIATCSLHLGGIKVLTLNEQRDEM